MIKNTQNEISEVRQIIVHSIKTTINADSKAVYLWHSPLETSCAQRVR